MKERGFDEMIAYFNRRVSEMDIAQDYKMELLGMVTALGYKHEKTAQQEQQWIPVSERLPEQDQICLICGKNGGIYVARFWRNETLILWTKTGTGKFAKAVAWMPLPNPYKEEES